MRATDQVLTLIAALPFSVPTTPAMWELKVVGLAVIFVYAFFKFAWSYRLFNYLAIMIGAAPPPSQKDTAEARTFVYRASRVCAEAGLHFNRGQRAFFFALGYLGWFLGPLELALSTTGVLIVMWRRQFASAVAQAFDSVKRSATNGQRRPASDHPDQIATAATIIKASASAVAVMMRSSQSSFETEIARKARCARSGRILAVERCRMPWVDPLLKASHEYEHGWCARTRTRTRAHKSPLNKIVRP